MSNDHVAVGNDYVPIEELPHVSNYLDMATADRVAAEDKAGEVMERSFGLDRHPDTKREVQARAREEGRPVSDPPRFTDEPSSESNQDADIDARLDRLFGVKPQEPEQRPQPQTTAPVERQDWRAEQDASDSAMFSMADVDTYTQYQIGLQSLNNDVARFNEQAEALMQQANPSNQSEIVSQIHAARIALEQRASQLDGVGKQIEGALTERMKGRFQRHVASETAKFNSAVPDTDTAKLRSYLSKLGFTERDISTAHDHRLLVAFEKARRYDEQKQQQKPNVVRRVTKVDRVRSDKEILRRAQRTGNHDAPGVADALDRDLSRIFR